jgi:hypothetical protein
VGRSLRAARHSRLTSPDPVRTPRRKAHRPSRPDPETTANRTKGERRDAHARIHLQKPIVKESASESTTLNNRWIQA